MNVWILVLYSEGEFDGAIPFKTREGATRDAAKRLMDGFLQAEALNAVGLNQMAIDDVAMSSGIDPSDIEEQVINARDLYMRENYKAVLDWWDELVMHGEWDYPPPWNYSLDSIEAHD